MSQMIKVTIEGKEELLEDREYTGAELRKKGSIPLTSNLVREEKDGSEKGSEMRSSPP